MTIKDILVENYKKAIKALDNQANGRIINSCIPIVEDQALLLQTINDQLYAIAELCVRLKKLEEEYHTFVWDYQVEKKQSKALRMDKKDGKRG
jgi:L-lysine 2,3-aminomutase